ncbi:MAG: carboxylesterase/lipase family protein [Acidimicrobiales bacterium]
MDGVVEVRSGRVRGVRRRGLWSFSGIPYAGSLEGGMRWRPPAEPEPWAGIRECDVFGPIAPQSPGLVEMSLGGEPDEHAEDCLSLNVWTPGLDGGRRPVMVWVHGGSFLSGSGAGSLYRGGMLAREGDVVVVTINYRLGLLGFLAHPALEDPGQTWLGGEKWSGFGNWGLADQVAALQWVHDHIADFGGDPGSVTLFGESAGGMSVSSLLAVPSARDLFHRAIVQSGPPYAGSAEVAARRAEQLADHLGVPLTRAALEQVPADDLVRAAAEFDQVSANHDDAGLLMLPVADGGLLPAHPEDVVASGSAARIPLLIGTTRDESAFFTVGNPTLASLDDDGLLRWMRRLTPDRDEARRVVAAVGAARTARGETVAPRDLWVAIATEFIFRLPTVRFADAHASSTEPGVGTYAYLFTWESPAFGGYLGSCHALDIPFVFGTVHNPAIQGFAGGGDEAFALSAAMRRAWTDFARSGAPEGWEAWDVGRRPVRVLGPWPGRDGIEHRVDRPRDEELEAVASVVTTRPIV